jgi:AraC-like DNA-binding protein
MAQSSPIIRHFKSIIPRPRKAKTGRIILFILALAFTVTASSPAMADALAINCHKVFHDVTILSETGDSVTVKLRDGHVMEVPVKSINLILKPGMKLYVYRNDWTGLTAWFKSSDESGFTFSDNTDGSGEFTVKKSDVFFMSSKFPEEAGKDPATAYAPPWLAHDVWSLLYAGGFLQGIVLAFMLFRRKTGNHKANRALALFIINGLVAISGGFTGPYIYTCPYLNQVFSSITSSTVFLIGPLLYLYVIAITRPGFRLRPRHCLHLVPAIMCCIYFLFHAVMMNSEELGIYLSFSSSCFVPSIFHRIFSTAFGIHPVIYVVLSMRFLTRHRRRMQDLFSSTEKLNLSWLSYILRFMAGAGGLWLLPWLASRVILFLNFDHHFVLLGDVVEKTFSLAGGILVILFYAIGYRGLMQPEIFAGMPDDLVEAPDESDQKMSLSPEKAREIMDRVTGVMQEQRPYLDPGLTLPVLADMAGVSRNLLSQAINERTGQNFYDFVNFYRVETVKERLKDPEKRDMNVLHIAFDAGFNTKATFNAVFKKSTGLTPSQYRKNFEAAEGSAPATPMTLQ